MTSGGDVPHVFVTSLRDFTELSVTMGHWGLHPPPLGTGPGPNRQRIPRRYERSKRRNAATRAEIKTGMIIIAPIGAKKCDRAPVNNDSGLTSDIDECEQ